jgi:hypothetical protein
MYSGGSRNSRGSRPNGSRKQQPKYIEEEEEYASDYDDGSFDEGDFEMVRPPPGQRANSRAPSTVGGRGSSRRPDIRKIRIKVHAAEDVRYIMVGSAVEFPDLADRIREKFGLKKRFKIKVRDEDMPNGDMITMGDQDDLDMVIMGVKASAKKERLDMGKMEVSFQPFSFLHVREHHTDRLIDMDTRNLNDLMNDESESFLWIFSSHLFLSWPLHHISQRAK